MPRPSEPVLVVGDLVLDNYVWGEVDRISPEAPVQVLRWKREADAPGGAANVALNLASLGCPVRLVGVVGRDAEGRRLLRALRSGGVDAAGVLAVSDRPTTRKTRVIARGQHMLRIDRETVGPLPREEARRLAAAVQRLGRTASGIVCSDYAKGVLGPEVLGSVFQVAIDRKRKARIGGRPFVLVDPKGADFGKYRGADLLTPNEGEAIRAGGGSSESSSGTDLEDSVRRLMRETGARSILATRGPDGMDLFQRTGRDLKRIHIPVSQSHEVFDVTGAGDTVAAVMGMCAFAGVPLPEAARMANTAAGIVVGMVGTAVIEPQALGRALDGGLSQSGLKILPRGALKKRVEEARARGERVVFTNGCFDLLHTGHLYLLQRARALGDMLVVGMNDDASIRRLKGPTRPLVSQEQRAEILASLRFVDYVSLFHEPTPIRLIRALRPAVLVKGGDYALDEVVGREVVESYGGRVELIPLLPGFSTTALVEAIRRGRS